MTPATTSSFDKWWNSRSAIFSRLCSTDGESFTNGEAVISTVAIVSFIIFVSLVS